MGHGGKNVIRDAHFSDAGHLSDEGVSLYVDALKLGEVQKLPQSLIDHASGCLRCKQNITGVYALVAEEDYRNLGPHPTLLEHPAQAPSRFPAHLRIAAIVVAVVGMAVFLYFQLMQTPSERVTGPPQPSETALIPVDSVSVTPPVAKGEGKGGGTALAAAYEESSDLEDLIGTERRSEGISVQEPAIGQSISGPVTFRWQTNLGAPVTLLVYTNREALLERAEVSRTPYTLKTSLSPGLYYWKLVADGDLLYVGKFLAR